MPACHAILISWALVQAPPPQTEEARIGQLIERLSEGDIETRERAVVELRTMGGAPIPALEAAAASSDAGLRIVARRLLHDLSATSALIEDLRSDEIPENARAARAKLRQRYGPKVRGALLEALRSDDDQQAIQAAFLLTRHRDAAAALAGTPEILERAARVIARGRDSGFRWVAVEAVMALGAAATEDERGAAWTRAVVDADPADAHWGVLAVHQVSTREKAPFPAALMRHYLKNLMNDTVEGNARQCRYILRLIGPSLAPALRSALAGYDAQARAMATDLLLEWKQEDLPAEALVEAMSWSSRAREEVRALGKSAAPFLLPALRHNDPDVAIEAAQLLLEIETDAHVEAVATSLSRLLGRGGAYSRKYERAKNLLARLGSSAEPALQAGLKDADPLVALSAARGLLVLDRERHLSAVLARAESELKEDARRENARRASQLIFELGSESVPRLRAILKSASGQSLVCTAAVLARLGRLDPTPEVLEAVLAHADRFEEADEPGALVELLAWSEPVRAEVMRRLERKSASKADALRVLLMDHEEEPWLHGRR